MLFKLYRPMHSQPIAAQLQLWSYIYIYTYICCKFYKDSYHGIRIQGPKSWSKFYVQTMLGHTATIASYLCMISYADSLHHIMQLALYIATYQLYLYVCMYVTRYICSQYIQLIVGHVYGCNGYSQEIAISSRKPPFTTFRRFFHKMTAIPYYCCIINRLNSTRMQ